MIMFHYPPAISTALKKPRAGKTYIYQEETLSRTVLTWKDPPGQLGKEREGERTDRGEMRQDKQTAYLTLSHVTAS